MDDKAYIPYHTAKRFLIDLIKNNDFSGDEEVTRLLHSVLQEKSCIDYLTLGAMSRIFIDKEARIFLPDYTDRELKMPYLPKTVFLFFLLHPEGVAFKSMHNYLQELYDLYQIVAIEKNIEAGKIKQVLANLVEPVNNSIYENCSRIRKTLLDVVGPSRIGIYSITGRRGDCHFIRLERKLLVVEHPRLREMGRARGLWAEE